MKVSRNINWSRKINLCNPTIRPERSLKAPFIKIERNPPLHMLLFYIKKYFSNKKWFNWLCVRYSMLLKIFSVLWELFSQYLSLCLCADTVWLPSLWSINFSSNWLVAATWKEKELSLRFNDKGRDGELFSSISTFCGWLFSIIYLCNNVL